MAEGVTRLNQQVVDTGYWNRADLVDQSGDRASSRPHDHGQRERRLEDIRRAVEADIIPRVLLNRGREPADRAQVVPGAVVADAEVLLFVKLLLNHDDEATVSAHLVAVQARGVSIEHMYLQLFQPAARHIGELWCDDRCSFVDVTLAVGTMQRLLRVFGPDFHKHGRPADGGRQAMLVPLPGDQHTFGLSMVTEFFRRAGWSVWSIPLTSCEELGEAVNKAWFNIVGFSASCEDRLDELRAAISLVRRESCNGGVGIMVGGPLFVERPDFVARVGADAMGQDAAHALARAESFVAPATGP